MIGAVVLPGEKLVQFEEGDTITDQFTLDDSNGIISNEVGVLKEQRTKKGKVISISSSPLKVLLNIFDQKMQYFPKANDYVIGVVTGKFGDSYSVELGKKISKANLVNCKNEKNWEVGSYKQAVLGVTDFQGATQKLRPNLALKSLVYARVDSFCPFLKIKLTCQTIHKSKEWTSGEAFFGELKGGLDFQVTPAYAKQLLKDDSVFGQIKKLSSFEVAIGVNGVIWIKAAMDGNNVIIMNMIKACEGIGTASETQKIIQEFSTFMFPSS